MQQLGNDFYKRFCHEYLPTLQSRAKWRRIQENLKVGDIVLIVKENSPRGQWPLGKVTEVKVGRDNLVRSAVVKYKSKSKVISINQLILLEASDALN